MVAPDPGRSLSANFLGVGFDGHRLYVVTDLREQKMCNPVVAAMTPLRPQGDVKILGPSVLSQTARACLEIRTAAAEFSGQESSGGGRHHIRSCLSSQEARDLACSANLRFATTGGWFQAFAKAINRPQTSAPIQQTSATAAWRASREPLAYSSRKPWAR